jgi:DNA repair exonuclease SbcCD ATPase subunit
MNDDKMNTQPMIEALFARLDEWGAKYATQLEEIRKDIRGLQGGQEELRAGQEELRAGQEELRAGQEELRAGQEELRAEVKELRAGQQELRKLYEQLRSDFNTGMRRVERKIEILNDNLLTMKADIRDLEVRVEKLESERLG